MLEGCLKHLQGAKYLPYWEKLRRMITRAESGQNDHRPKLSNQRIQWCHYLS